MAGPRRHRRLRPAAPHPPLAVLVQKVELQVDVVVVKAGRGLFLAIGLPRLRGEAQDRFLVIGGQQAEAAFHPALEHRALGVVAVEHPALQQTQIAGAVTPLAVHAFRPGKVRVQAEGDGHVVLEQVGGGQAARAFVQRLEQDRVLAPGGADAQAARVVVEGFGAQRLRRDVQQVGAVRPERQGRIRIDRPPVRIPDLAADRRPVRHDALKALLLIWILRSGAPRQGVGSAFGSADASGGGIGARRSVK